MAQILPPAKNLGDVVGKGMREGFQETFFPALQQQYQRGQLQKALQSLDNLPEGATPYEIGKHLLYATAGLPDQGRIVSALYGPMVNQSIARTAPAALSEASGIPANESQDNLNSIAAETQQPQPIEATGKKSSHNIDTIANQYIGEVRPDLVNPATQYGAIATFDSAIKQDLTPDEEARLRQQLLDKFKNPDVVNPVIDRVRQGVQTRFNEAQAKYGFDKEKLMQIQNKWKNFTEDSIARLQPHIGKYGENFPRTKEVLTNKYNQYAGALQTNLTPEQMHTNAMALLQNDINKLDALHALPSMPPIRTASQAKNYIDSYKDTYKDLADAGFTEALKEDAILNKDLGNEEFHSLIWGDQTDKNLLNSVHSLKAPEEYSDVSGYPPGHKKYNEKYPQQKNKYISDLSKKLKNLSPTDDLILTRAMVLDSGGTIDDYVKALAEAQKEGLKLSEFQRSQLQEINIPRIPPLWEIFNEKEGAGVPGAVIGGVVGGLNWTPFINYLRGKK